MQLFFTLQHTTVNFIVLYIICRIRLHRTSSDVCVFHFVFLQFERIHRLHGGMQYMCLCVCVCVCVCACSAFVSFFTPRQY
jgi:hypothetical protein